MLLGQRIIVVMPAYNAAQTLAQTYRDIPHDIVDEVILVDDCSRDTTVQKAHELGIQTYIHTKNRGYGANQKTCYTHALAHGADVIVMLHPDYQYDPRLIRAMCSMIIEGPYDTVLGSRILGGQAMKGGMPFYKYISNRFLTAFQNLCTGAKLSEYHTGYRAFRSNVLKKIPFETYPDDFIFDNFVLCDILAWGFLIGEVSCPTKYFPEASSINFQRSLNYGLHVFKNSIKYLFCSRFGSSARDSAVPKVAKVTNPNPNPTKAVHPDSKESRQISHTVQIR
ncbi:glycosyltransferase family 2 protein [Candidatus Peregrinibacteria bacterium]|nr:glycosyltransferase family 2 protein [Candidatus Peregrinibacteria bacterium]